MTPNVYVEARPRGRPEVSAIEDYVVEGHRTTYSQPSKHSRRHNRLVQKERPCPVGRARATSERQKETRTTGGAA